ncbi:MAG: cache domain-containing protein, partial [Nannocystaceae bacterium]
RPSVQNAALRDEHLPILFSYMGTTEGIMATYPGRDTARDDYDPRARPWYQRGSRERAPIWMAIDSKTRRKGLVLTGAMAVREPADDSLLAVVAIDVEFTTIIDKLLMPPSGIPEDAECYLLDQDGQVVVQSSMRAVSDTLREIEAEPFPFPKIPGRFRFETSGHAIAELEGSKMLVFWSAIEATNWTFVVTMDVVDFTSGNVPQ